MGSFAKDVAYILSVDELLAQLILAIIELFFEAVPEFIGAAILDVTLRAIAHAFESLESMSPVLATFGYVISGTIAGLMSLLIFPHPIVHQSRIHGISLLASPLVTGSVMSLVGLVMRQIGIKVTRIESFGYGFAFAFGVALTRFLFIT